MLTMSLFLAFTGINTTENETSPSGLRSSNLHHEPETRHSTDPPKVTVSGSSSTLPSLTWKWTTDTAAGDTNTALAQNTNTSTTKATLTTSVSHTNTLDSGQPNNMKPGRNKVTATYDGKQNGTKSSLAHQPTQKKSIKMEGTKKPSTIKAQKNNLSDSREDAQEMETEKSVSHSPKQEKNTTEFISENMTSTTQENHQQEEKKDYQGNQDSEHAAGAPDEEESLTPTDADDQEEEKKAIIVRQLRSLFERNHTKGHMSKRSKEFKHDGQIHFDTLTKLKEIHNRGKEWKSPGKSLCTLVFIYFPLQLKIWTSPDIELHYFSHVTP